jgi:putative zinc finger protein
MSQDLHKRAERLIAQGRVEGVSAAEREWLEAHLEGCSRCQEFASATERALRLFRSMPVQVDRSLVQATRLRVYLRALELRDERSRLRGLWVSCALSWLFGVVTAPLVWHAFAWVGHRMSLPDLIWQMGFVLWWAVPALIGIAILAAQKAQSAGEREISLRRPTR